MEPKKTREMRRSLSSQLTKVINSTIDYPEIRVIVLKGLSELNVRLKELDASCRETMHISNEEKLIRFYMKGGNAYACVYDPTGLEVTQFGGGGSDWDTQIMVDPWAPIPIQTYLYGRIEDLVRDQFTKTGVEIARKAASRFPQSPKTYTAEDADKVKAAYSVACDESQTFRQILDYSRINLWLNNQYPLSDEKISNASLIPSMLFNDSIQPFILFRLGYTWHAEPLTRQNPFERDPALPGPEIDRPVLMELIDVTLPRRNTIEAVAVWEKLRRYQLQVQELPVVVNVKAVQTSQQLPLPGASYHLHEQAYMLCEVAAGRSHSLDKLPSRLKRFETLWATRSVDDKQKALEMVSAMAGLANLDTATVEPDPRVLETIRIYAPAYTKEEETRKEGVSLALKLMDAVGSRTISQDTSRFIRARAVFKIIFLALRLDRSVSEIAFSDDLALLDVIVEGGYIARDAFPFSGLEQGVVLRVRGQRAARGLAEIVRKAFEQLAKVRGIIEKIAVETGASESVLAMLQALLNAKLSAHLRESTMPRPSGNVYEATIVLFADKRAIGCYTLTDATGSESPFKTMPGGENIYRCSLLDFASQRKTAAALIEDFSVETALSKQYELLKWLLPDV